MKKVTIIVNVIDDDSFFIVDFIAARKYNFENRLFSQSNKRFNRSAVRLTIVILSFNEEYLYMSWAVLSKHNKDESIVNEIYIIYK